MDNLEKKANGCLLIGLFCAQQCLNNVRALGLTLGRVSALAFSTLPLLDVTVHPPSSSHPNLRCVPMADVSDVLENVQFTHVFLVHRLRISSSCTRAEAHCNTIHPFTSLCSTERRLLTIQSPPEPTRLAETKTALRLSEIGDALAWR